MPAAVEFVNDAAHEALAKSLGCDPMAMPRARTLTSTRDVGASRFFCAGSLSMSVARHLAACPEDACTPAVLQDVARLSNGFRPPGAVPLAAGDFHALTLADADGRARGYAFLTSPTAQGDHGLAVIVVTFDVDRPALLQRLPLHALSNCAKTPLDKALYGTDACAHSGFVESNRPLAKELASVLRRAAHQTAGADGDPRPYEVLIIGHSDAAGLCVLNALACAAMACVSFVFMYTEGCPAVLSAPAQQHFQAMRSKMWGVNIVHHQDPLPFWDTVDFKPHLRRTLVGVPDDYFSHDVAARAPRVAALLSPSARRRMYEGAVLNPRTLRRGRYAFQIEEPKK